MNRKTLGALAALNAVLVLAITAVTLVPSTAQGQFSGGGGDYTMIAAQRSGQSSHVVHIFDTKRGVTISVEPSQKGRGDLNVIAFRDLSGDFKPGGGR